MQHHWDAAPFGRQYRWRSYVATSGENHLALLTAQQLRNRNGARK
jgi:hypothetical protein